MSSNKVSLVLSSGGARGVAHISIIESLLKEGYDIVEISGTSIGSLVAAFYACGKLDKFKKWILKLDKIKTFSLMDFTVSQSGIIKGDKVFSSLKKIIPDEKIENLKIPISIIATDIFNNKEVVIRSGSMYDAIRASCSIPGLVKPYSLNGVDYVDGGVLNPLPINKLHYRENIITVNLNSPPLKKSNKKETTTLYMNYFNSIKKFFSNNNNSRHLGIYDITYRSVHMIQNQLSVYQIEKHKTLKNINIPCDVCHPLEFYKAGEILKSGTKFYNETKNNY
jgi:NTE family protein